MADTKTTALTENTAPALADLVYMVDDPGGSAASNKVTYQNMRSQLTPHAAVGGRLTLTTGTPVTTADVSAAATLYFTPYSGSQFCGQIGLYDGSSKWDVLDFTEASLSLVGYTASKPYDIWAYNNSGTIALESTVWTDGTTRATALALQNGIYVKTGATTRRYLGTIYINSSGAQTDDSLIKRFVWNYYNRVPKRLYDFDETSHTYNSATARSWNNDATIRVEFVTGVAEDSILVNCSGYSAGDADGRIAQTGVGLDITNASSIIYGFVAVTQASMTSNNQPIAPPAAGYHFLQAIEREASSASSTFAAVYYGAIGRF